MIINNFTWYPVQSTFARVNNTEETYISIETIVSQREKVTDNIYLVNASVIANKAGNPLTSNLVQLGALAKTDGFPLSLSQLEEVVPKVVPKKAIDANLKALEMGYDSL